MPYNAKKSREKVAESHVEFDGDRLNFSYYPNRYTPEFEEESQAAVKDVSLAGATIAALLGPLMASWDVVDEVPRTERGPDGAEVPVVDPATGEQVVDLLPVPCTPHGFRRVPLSVLGVIHRKIVDEMMPGEARSTSSESSFS